MTTASPVLIPTRTWRDSAGSAGVEVVDRFEQPKAGAHRPLGVVFVRQRCPEHPHHRVADELLHRSAEALDLLPHARVVSAEAAGDVLGVGAIRGLREPDEVDEQGATDLPLLAGRGRVARERTAARLAEPRSVRIRLAARRTGQHALSLGRPLPRDRAPARRSIGAHIGGLTADFAAEDYRRTKQNQRRSTTREDSPCESCS